ncbi:hypothetical protein AB0M20_25800 [Actinoplanes sp. NPDC051633]|uniref:hypothetical protein n=1 Tax=Actinoplanes sp. NPDC051633 TaxID=3155670 RepID=UPI003434D57B
MPINSVRSKAQLLGRIILIASLAGVIAGSIICILAAPNSGWWVAGSCLAAVSGAIFGASFGLAVGRWAGQDVLEQLDVTLRAHVSTLVDNPADAILSRAEHLEPFRCVLHHYHLTILDGVHTWRYRVYRFDSCPPGQYELRTTFNVADPRSGARNKYVIVLAVRDIRVILVQRRLSGAEPSVVEIFPTGSEGFRSCVAGVGHMQNWDGRHMTTKCLLSRTPLINGISEGTVSRSDDIDLLQKRWHADYSTTLDIL